MNTTSQLIYAGFGRRTVAYLVDSVLAFALLLPYTYLIQYWLMPIFGHAKFLYGMAEFVLTDIPVMIAIVIFWVKRGATPGMMLLELKLIDEHSGGMLTWKQAIARLFLRLLAILSVFGILMLIWDARKQGLHDKICHTLVVDALDDYEYVTYP